MLGDKKTITADADSVGCASQATSESGITTPDSATPDAVEGLARRLGVPRLVASLLWQRGWADEERARAHLTPRLDALSHPRGLPAGMAVHRHEPPVGLHEGIVPREVPQGPLGPEGGDAGGRIVVQGSIFDLMEHPESRTGAALAQLLGRSPEKVAS